MTDDSTEPRENPAGRLLRIVRKVAETKSRDAIAGWIRVLHVSESNDSAKERAVAQGLTAAHDQLDLVEEFLLGSGIRRVNYESGLNMARKALAYRHLAGSWSQVQESVREPVPSVLALVSDMMDPEPSSISDEEFDVLRGASRDLRKAVLAPDVPDDLRAVLLRHLDAFDRAVNEHLVKGDAAFEDAAAELASLIFLDQQILNKYRDRPEVRGVGWLWSRVTVATKDLLLVGLLAGNLLQGTNAFFQLRDRFAPQIEARATETPIPLLLSSGSPSPVAAEPSPADEESLDDPVEELEIEGPD